MSTLLAIGACCLVGGQVGLLACQVGLPLCPTEQGPSDARKAVASGLAESLNESLGFKYDFALAFSKKLAFRHKHLSLRNYEYDYLDEFDVLPEEVEKLQELSREDAASVKTTVSAASSEKQFLALHFLLFEPRKPLEEVVQWLMKSQLTNPEASASTSKNLLKEKAGEISNKKVQEEWKKLWNCRQLEPRLEELLEKIEEEEVSAKNRQDVAATEPPRLLRPVGNRSSRSESSKTQKCGGLMRRFRRQRGRRY